MHLLCMSKFSLSQAEAAQAEAAKEICIKTVENFGESFTTAPDLEVTGGLKNHLVFGAT